MSDVAFSPGWFSHPGVTISALLENRGKSISTLASEMGSHGSLVYNIIAGKSPIDDTVAEALAAALAGSPTFWLRRQAQYDESLRRTVNAIPAMELRNWLSILPTKDMVGMGWVPAAGDIRDKAAALLSYFDVADPEEWRERYARFANDFSFRTSPTFENKLGSLAAWLRQGEIQASVLRCKSWDPDHLRGTLRDLRNLTKSKNPRYFVSRIRSICAESGLAVVFVRAPTGCRASGASRFVSPKKAILLLSFRYLSDDHFWFSFFHEIGHLLLHGSDSTFIDGAAAAPSSKEEEADSFAAEILLPNCEIDRLCNLRPKAKNVIRFAVSAGVSPGIVVGQMQHMGLIGRDQLNFLKRRYTWDQVSAALV